MDEKGKSYWRPPEVPKLVPPMPDFDDFPISALNIITGSSFFC